jgi:predicted nucleic acid-binding protein
MVSGVLIDSSFYINHLKSGRNPFKEIAAAGEDWEIFTCGMVMLEVLRGVRDPRQLAKIEASFSLMNFIPTSNPVWTKARQLAWQLDRTGLIIPAQDHLIAACALQAGIAVLTADGHFRHVPGLTVLDGLTS